MKKLIKSASRKGIVASRNSNHRSLITAATYNGFDESEFDEYQLEEIRDGLKKGLDVSWYANPEFDRWQMRQIRYGLEDGLDVSQYADPSLRWDKMEKIRKSLANRPPQSKGYEVYRTDTGDELADLLNIMIHDMAFEPADIADWCNVPVDKLYENATVEDLIGLLTESGTIEQLEGTSCEYLLYDDEFNN